MQNFFDKVFLLFRHRALSNIFRSFRRKFDGPVVSTVFCLSNIPVCGEKIFVKTFFPSFLDIDRKFNGLCSKLFQPSWRNCFLQVRRINLKTNICFENFLYVSPSFSHFERTINGFLCRNINSSFVKTAYHLSRRSVGETFFRIGSFLLIIDTWAKIFSGISTKTSLRCRQNCFRPVHCNVLWQKFFLSKMFFSHLFRTFSKNLSVFFSETFSVNSTKLHSTSPKEKFEDKTLFWQRFCLLFFMFVRNWTEIKWFFSSENNRQIWHTSLPRIQEDFLKKIFWKSSFFDHWAMSNFCMSFRRKIVGPLSVLLSVVNLASLRWKKNSSNIFSPSFSDMNRKLISLCSSFFRPSGRNCFLQVRRINLKTNICFETFLYFFSSFSDFERTINGVFCRKTNSSFVKTDYHLSRRFVEQIFLPIGFFCSPLKLERIFSWHSD